MWPHGGETEVEFPALEQGRLERLAWIFARAEPKGVEYSEMQDGVGSGEPEHININT